MLHPYLTITATSPQRPLSSVAKVAVVELFNHKLEQKTNLEKNTNFEKHGYQKKCSLITFNEKSPYEEHRVGRI